MPHLLWQELPGTVIVLVSSILWTVKGEYYRCAAFLAFSLLLLTLFFRNPQRQPLAGITITPSTLLSPADGRVISIDYGNWRVDGQATTRIVIFLSVLDVHVQRAPIDGEVIGVRHTPGSLWPAFGQASGRENERCDTILRLCPCPHGSGKDLTVVVRQIAGCLAQRIRTWISPGQRVTRGQIMGMICFGSRVELFLPMEVEPRVGVGRHVYAGQTVIAEVVSR